MRRVFLLCLFAQKAAKAKKASTPPPTKPPLVSVDITKLPEGATHLDLWLLCGQSNMKGRRLAKLKTIRLSVDRQGSELYQR